MNDNVWNKFPTFSKMVIRMFRVKNYATVYNISLKLCREYNTTQYNKNTSIAHSGRLFSRILRRGQSPGGQKGLCTLRAV